MTAGKTTSHSQNIVNYYVFIVADSDKARLSEPSAYQLARYRLGRKEWGLNARTRYRRQIRTQDRVLIYASGRRELGMSFVGSAVVATDPQPVLSPAEVDSPEGHSQHQHISSVKLTDVVIFDTPVSVRPILKRLSFVKISKGGRWGTSFLGGVARIARNDYNTVLDSLRSTRTSAQRPAPKEPFGQRHSPLVPPQRPKKPAEPIC